SVPDTTPNSLAICATDFGESMAKSSDSSAGVSSVGKSGGAGDVSGSSRTRLCSSVPVISSPPKEAATASQPAYSAEAEMSASLADFDSWAMANTDEVIAQ